jgi:Tol biopolymer transport system component
VAALNNSSPDQLELLPVGTGQSRQITHDSLEHIRVGWAPNGKAVVFEASETNHAPRTYFLNLEDGKAHPITPEGTTGTLVSPDSKSLLGLGPDGKRWIYPLEGGEPQPLGANISESEAVEDWEPDGKSLLVEHRGSPTMIWRVFLNSSRREQVRTLAPSDASGIVSIGGPRFSADRKSYAYTYFRILSDLYVVDGLK